MIMFSLFGKTCRVSRLKVYFYRSYLILTLTPVGLFLWYNFTPSFYFLLHHFTNDGFIFAVLVSTFATLANTAAPFVFIA